MLKLCSKLTTLYKGFLGNIWKYIWDIWDSLLVLKLCCGVCQTNWIRRQRYILVITLPRTLKSKRNFVYKRSTSSKKPLSKHCIVWIGVDLSIPKTVLCRRKETQIRWNCAPSELSVMTMATMGKMILRWWYSKRNMNEWQLFCKG